MKRTIITLELLTTEEHYKIKISGSATAPEMCLLADELLEAGLIEIMNPNIPASNLQKAQLLSDTISLFKSTINKAVSGELFKKGGE